jgi:hypothetical protein
MYPLPAYTISYSIERDMFRGGLVLDRDESTAEKNPDLARFAIIFLNKWK